MPNKSGLSKLGLIYVSMLGQIDVLIAETFIRTLGLHFIKDVSGLGKSHQGLVTDFDNQIWVNSSLFKDPKIP